MSEPRPASAHSESCAVWGGACDCRRNPPVAIPTDGMESLLSVILRKYGGTMKGRGDHDIYVALVRYRDSLRSVREATR